MNVFDSYIDAGLAISDEVERALYYSAILMYLRYGKEPDFESMTETAKGIFIAIKPSLEKSRQASENGKKGGRPKAENDKLPDENLNENSLLEKTDENEKAKSKSKSNYKKETTPNGVVKKSERFSPPTPQEVRDYVQEQDIGAIDAQRFCDYYAAQGWKLSNGNAMKDWRAAARRWISQSNKQPYQSTKPKGGVLDDELRETIERLEQGARSSPG